MVCLDEVPVQLVDEARTPQPAVPGRAARFDYEYRRSGTSNLFLAFTPLLGWRTVQVTEGRTAVDFAKFLEWIVEHVYEMDRRVVLVTGNLNAHDQNCLH